MFETINKLVNLINFGELKLPSFLLSVSPSFVAPIKFVKCQTTNENFDDIFTVRLQQQQLRQHQNSNLKSQSLIFLPLMIKILNQFIKMIDMKTAHSGCSNCTTSSSNYSKLICSIAYLNDKKNLMSATGGTPTTATTAKKSGTCGGGTGGADGGSTSSLLYLDYNIIYFLKIDDILCNFPKQNSTNGMKYTTTTHTSVPTSTVMDQSFCESVLGLRNVMTFLNNDIDITPPPSPPPPNVTVSHIGNVHSNNSKKRNKKMSSPPNDHHTVNDDNHHQHSKKPLVKLNNCEDSNSIVPELRQTSTERKRRKRRKKNNHQRSVPAVCPNNNNNNSTVDKMSLETTNKKKRRKYRKRQRNYDRDTKAEWLADQNKQTTVSSGGTQKNGLNKSITSTTTICEEIFSNKNEQTKICVSFKTLPSSTPLPSPFIFPMPPMPPQQLPRRQRQISECSNDSLEICFLDDCDIDGMVIDYDDDDDHDENDDDDDEDEVDFCLKTYRTRHRLCHTTDDSDETDWESEYRKKVRFDLKPKIHVMRTWDFAHRQARIGEWETLARDRVRFNDRITKLEKIISPVLSREHRNKIFLNRFM